MKLKKYAVILVGLCLFLSSCSIDSADRTNDYPHPQLAKLGGAGTAELSFPAELESNLNNTAKLFELNTSLDAAKNQIEACFGFTLNSFEKQEGPNFDFYSSDDHLVCIDRTTGYWTYESNDDIDAIAASNEVISDEEAISIATAFVEENHLWDGAFYNIIVTDVTRGGWTSGETIVAKKVWFFPEVDGIGVLGIFRISVTLDATGNITDVFKQVSAISESQDVVLVSSDELSARIENNEYSASFSENITNATLTDCHLYYYADAYQNDGRTFLYPVYVAAGDGMSADESTTFDIIIDALPS